MKTLIISCLAAAAIVSLSACKTVVERPSTQTRTTTTEESSMHTPVSATSTTETHSVRSN